MSSVEWPSVDAHNVSLPTIVSSTDLFDGEIFGDELIDIYNNSVHGDDHDNGTFRSVLDPRFWTTRGLISHS